VRAVRSVVALALLSAVAHAERRVALDTSNAQAERAAGNASAPLPREPREALAALIAAELETVGKTATTVDTKLSEAETARMRRVRAAYRILRVPIAPGEDAQAGDRMPAARRRAAARLLLERDRAERQLLADEVAQLREAETTLRAETSRVPTLALPESVLPPAKGTIVRRFGTIIHDRSKAVLARRGIDFEVTALAVAVAPADGVVRYAGPMRGLDNGVLLDHGDYMTVVAKLSPLAIPAGTKVVRGDRIGRAARARVYFEVRAKVGPGGLPIDPEPLLARPAHDQR
jgi:septal ring factor EnvC (AmiA/AmiB activator)